MSEDNYRLLLHGWGGPEPIEIGTYHGMKVFADRFLPKDEIHFVTRSERVILKIQEKGETG